MKRQFTFLAVALTVAALSLAGCSEPQQSTTEPNNTPVVVQTVETIDTTNDTATPPAATPPPGADENTDSTVAQVGFGKKGHYDSNDYISTTVGARFRAEEAITLSLVVNAMQQYKALHGAFPKTHDEFMSEIVKLNNIRLPELNEGEEYLYDPELAAETGGKESLRILTPKK